MPIVIKSRRDIEKMRRAGAVAHRILLLMKEMGKPGITTGQIDQLVRDQLNAAGAVSGSKNYPDYKEGKGFPGYSCISVNEEVVHGIPGPRILKEGDIVTYDLALSLDGFFCDTALTVGIGHVSPRIQKLMDVTRNTLDLALSLLMPGKRWSDIARVMQHNVEKNGFSVVREFVGHGIGRSMHEDPKIPNFVSSAQMRQDFVLRPGMTLAVEPMVVMGKRDVALLEDDWTHVTQDRLAAAHYEHTVAILDNGVDVLTDGHAEQIAV